MATSRTFGWIQNPSDFNKLRGVAAIFDKDSYTHKTLVNSRLKDTVRDKDLLKEMLDTLNTPKPIIANYALLKGKGKPTGGKRVDALCTGIAQAAIITQKGRAYSDDWTTDGFLRWAVSIGFLDYNHSNDTLSIPPLVLTLCVVMKERSEKRYSLQHFYLIHQQHE